VLSSPYTLLLLLFLISGCAAGPVLPGADLVSPPLSLRAKAVVELEKAEFRGRAVIVVKSPDLVRIDFLGPFNHVVAVIVSDGAGLTFYSNGEARSYKWHDPLLPYSFSPEELVSFLMGRPEKEGYYELDMDGEGNISRLVKLRDGAPVFKVFMDDYREVRGATIPFAIAIEDGEKRLDIRYSSVELNPEVEKDLFSLPARGLP
jgi:outer membrane lipoprotein-sorting protein